MVERWTFNPLCVGSIPTRSVARVAQSGQNVGFLIRWSWVQIPLQVSFEILLKLISGGVSSMCISSQISELVEDWCFILAHSAEYSCPMHRARFYAKCIILRGILVMFVQSNLTLPSSNVFWHCKSNLIQNMETSPERSQRKCTKPALTPWIDSIARCYVPRNPNTGLWKVWHVDFHRLC